jgi:hypothetical protein
MWLGGITNPLLPIGYFFLNSFYDLYYCLNSFLDIVDISYILFYINKFLFCFNIIYETG